RSLLTVGLLAAATFLIVAVELFHKQADGDFLTPSGGSGGFALVAETDVPVFQDLNQADVRKEWGLTDPLFAVVTVYPCRVRVVGLLEASIFQSEVLVSEESFRELFPRQEGFSFFLLECKGCTPDEVGQVQSALVTALAGQGVRVQTTASRLQAFLAVENTYL